jgi:hypothetical protein
MKSISNKYKLFDEKYLEKRNPPKNVMLLICFPLLIYKNMMSGVYVFHI